MIKVMIVDDQELIRQSLKIVLGVNSDMEVVCMTGDGDETLRKLREMRPESRPDVILMDIRMPVMDGVECTALIKKNYPDIKVIALTTFDDNEFIFGALKNGASGYLLKGSSVEELSEAIRTVHTGGAMLNPTVANTVIRQFSTMAQNIVSPELSDYRPLPEACRTRKSPKHCGCLRELSAIPSAAYSINCICVTGPSWLSGRYRQE